MKRPSRPRPFESRAGARKPGPGQRREREQPAAPTAWEQVARWYDALIGEQGGDHHRNILLPGVARLLAPLHRRRVLDVGCGQGVLARHLAAEGALVTGVDAAPSLIEAARSRQAQGEGGARFQVADAADLSCFPPASFDAAACVLAIQNVEPLEAVCGALSKVLAADGCCVLVMMHPCFRIPRQSHWVFDEDAKQQYRRVDRYLGELAIPIQMRPGSAPDIYTTSFHRPLSAYVNALGQAGLLVDRMEEWVSQRRSEGARAKAENRARDEFPLFLALRAVKR